jgi:hypothetical protein
MGMEQSRSSQLDLHHHYREWCEERRLDARDGNIFTLFVNDVLRRTQQACPESLVDMHTMSFGGADGGGGIIVNKVQGEFAERAHSAVGNISVVTAMSRNEYAGGVRGHLYTGLIRRVPETMASDVIVDAEPIDGQPTVAFTPKPFVDAATQYVQSKPYMHSVGRVVEMSPNRVSDLLEQLRAGLILLGFPLRRLDRPRGAA